MAENVICPICKSEAEAINVGLLDGVGIRCKTHGEFEVPAVAQEGYYGVGHEHCGILLEAEQKRRQRLLLQPLRLSPDAKPQGR